MLGFAFNAGDTVVSTTDTDRYGEAMKLKNQKILSNIIGSGQTGDSIY